MTRISITFAPADAAHAEQLRRHLKSYIRAGTIALVEDDGEAEIRVILVSSHLACDDEAWDRTRIPRSEGQRLVPIVVGAVAEMPAHLDLAMVSGGGKPDKTDADWALCARGLVDLVRGVIRR